MRPLLKRLRDRTPTALRPLWNVPQLGLLAWRRLAHAGRRRWSARFGRPGPAAQIHLSWSDEPHTTMTATWWTPTADNLARLEYRAARSAVWSVVDGVTAPSPGVVGHIHRATARDLLPGHQYRYRLSDDHGSIDRSGEHGFRTAPPPGPADVRFGFFCDTGLAGRRDGLADGVNVVRRALIVADLDLVLAGGDYAYSDSDHRYSSVGDAADRWFEQWEALSAEVPVMAQYGNHEIVLGETFDDWGPRFAHPSGHDDARSYSFEIADVHIVSLFVPNPPWPTAAQLDWLDHDLGSARADSNIRWTVVFQHAPIHAHGSSHPAVPSIRSALTPIFDLHRVDLHLSGHDQNYERTHPLRHRDGVAHVTSRTADRCRQGAGVVYAKVSPGGKRSSIGHDFSRLGAGSPDIIAVRDDSAHHIAIIDVEAAGRLRLRGYRVAPAGTEQIDEFTIEAD